MKQIALILIGCLMILLSFLVKKYPNLITDFKTMSKEEKDSFDIKSYSSIMRNIGIIWGCLVIIVPQACYFLGWQSYIGISLAAVCLLMSIILAAQDQKFKKMS